MMATIPAFEWVIVLNQGPISSANRHLGYGDVCSIQKGGKIAVVRDDGEKFFLVRYFIEDSAFGAECPSGTMFSISKERFSKMGPE